jgi:phosphate transport system substrate-binding protein
MIRAALLAALALLVLASRAQAAPAITMSGSPVAEAVVADLAYFYGHAVTGAPRFSLAGGDTDTGIADAARGVVDAGMVSRNLGPGDPPGLVLTPLALSGICLFTNSANPVPNLTRAQMQDILAGRITSWAQVPGSARTDAIVSATLSPTVGGRAVFESVFVDLTTPEVYSPRTFATDDQLRDFVEQTPAAWGFADLALTRPVHRVSYNGVPCDRTTIRLGTYPGQRPLGVVTRGRPRGALARFLRWAARSRTARRVITSRYIAVGQ